MTAPDGPTPYYPPPGQGWQPPAPPSPSKPKSGIPRWVIPVGVGVLALFIGVGIGSSGGSSAEANKTTAAAAKPAATVTATATKTSVSTVTATPPPPTATVTTTFTPQPVVAFNDGLFVIGKDIQPGRYSTQGSPGSPCYWARLSSLNTSDIIDNNFSEGPQTVEVIAGDVALSTRGGCAWSAA